MIWPIKPSGEIAYPPVNGYMVWPIKSVGSIFLDTFPLIYVGPDPDDPYIRDSEGNIITDSSGNPLEWT